MRGMAKVCKSYDAKNANDNVNRLVDILNASECDESELKVNLAKFQEKIREYEKRSSAKIPDEMKLAVITKMLGGALKTHVLMNAEKCSSFEKVACFLDD